MQDHVINLDTGVITIEESSDSDCGWQWFIFTCCDIWHFPSYECLWGYDRRVTSTLPCSAVVSINILYLYACNKKCVNGRNSADKNSWWLLLFLSLENHFFCFLFCCNIRVRINEKWKCYGMSKKFPTHWQGTGTKGTTQANLYILMSESFIKAFWLWTFDLNNNVLMLYVLSKIVIIIWVLCWCGKL